MRRGRPGRLAVFGAATAVLAVALVGCGSAESAGPHAERSEGELIAQGPALADKPPAEPSRHVGPQGRVGQFVAHCKFSHRAPDDPIVHPGHSGRSHSHEFYGSTVVDADSEIAELEAGGTSCDKRADTAAYWHPSLLVDGEVVEARILNAYYRAAPGVDPADLETMPTGLALIAGDQTATEPQPGEATGWTCGTRTTLSDDPPDCPSRAPLRMVLTFQDCWDGRHLDSEDHQSHVAYSSNGTCPEGFEVHIPQLTVSVSFPVWGSGHELALASGNIYSAHGDFWNAWQPAGLQREIDACIKRDVVCDLGTNREEEELFTG